MIQYYHRKGDMGSKAIQIELDLLLEEVLSAIRKHCVVRSPRRNRKRYVHQQRRLDYYKSKYQMTKRRSLEEARRTLKKKAIPNCRIIFQFQFHDGCSDNVTID